jgi:pyruvate/2-oxoacid:ferredoxin oxidoreductase beta subunit
MSDWAFCDGCESVAERQHVSTAFTHGALRCAGNAQGHEQTWADSLFEDNAEFGFGMRMPLDQQKIFAETLVTRLAVEIGAELVTRGCLSRPSGPDPSPFERGNYIKTLTRTVCGRGLRRSNARQEK